MDAPTGPPVSPDVQPKIEAEVLDLGPGIRRRHPLLIVVGLGLVVALLAGLLAWRLWPRPVPPVTLAELQGVYAGMVRGDGTNDASVLERRKAPPRPVSVMPIACGPLFESTAFNQFPAEALDGVGTYWVGDRQNMSLFTMRFVDAAAGARAYGRVNEALNACADTDVVVSERRVTTVRPVKTVVDFDNGARAQLGYVYDSNADARFAVHLLQFENTVTWQFRYESATGEYSPLSAQRLMDALLSQTRSVLELRD